MPTRAIDAGLDVANLPRLLFSVPFVARCVTSADELSASRCTGYVGSTPTPATISDRPRIQVRRILMLLSDLLLTRNWISLRELAGRFGVSTRTIRRDIHLLIDLGANVEWSGPQGSDVPSSVRFRWHDDDVMFRRMVGLR